MKIVLDIKDDKVSSAIEMLKQYEFLETDTYTHFASENILAKDWNKAEEQEAWQDL